MLASSNANSTKQKRDVKPEMSVCSHIARLLKEPTKNPKNGYYYKKRRESEDKGAVTVVKSVSQFCVSQDSDALVSQGRKSGKPDAEGFGTNSKGAIHLCI